MLEVDHYCEGVVFDAQGRGYLSEGKAIVQFTLDGTAKVWAETGSPNGHKILADGTHLVCDASQHAVLHLSADGKLLEPASRECDGKPLRGPNDLTLDTPNGGFYFSDPGGSSDEKPIGTVHYVDRDGKTHLVDDGLAFPNGIVLTPDGKKLLLAESKKNRVLVYDVTAPGKVGNRSVFADLPTKDHVSRPDRQSARRHVPGRGRQSVRGPLRHEAGAGAQPRGQAAARAIRAATSRPATWPSAARSSISSSSPAAWAPKAAKAACSASTWASKA